MLPFLKPKAVAGLIISKRKPDGVVAESHSEGEENHGLHAASDDLIRAIHAKDTKAVAAALRAAKDLMDSEGSSDEENDFDSQNEKAAAEAKE